MNFYEFYNLLNENTVSQEIKRLYNKKKNVEDERSLAEDFESFFIRAYKSFSKTITQRLNFSEDSKRIIVKWMIYQNLVNRYYDNYIFNMIADFLSSNTDENGNLSPQLASKFNNINFKPQDLLSLDREYHENLKKKRRNKPGRIGKEVLNFPDGYSWVDLERGYCDIESETMGHCGNRGSIQGDTILSLRDKQNRPHLTFILNKGNLGEMKGKNNDKPNSKYHPYIIELLKMPIINKIVGGGYLPQNNFKLEDLTKEQAEEIVKVNNNLEENYLKILVHNKWEVSEKEYIDSLQKLLIKYPKSIDEEILYKITENDKTPPDILLTISEKGDLNFTLKLNLVANKNTPQQVLDKLMINDNESSMYNKKNYTGAMAAWNRFATQGGKLNPKISSNYLNKITLYILNMLKDPKSDIDLYSFSPYVLINVVEHPNTSVETLSKIANNFKLVIDADQLIPDEYRGDRLGADLIDALIKNNKVSEDIKSELIEKREKYYPDSKKQ